MACCEVVLAQRICSPPRPDVPMGTRERPKGESVCRGVARVAAAATGGDWGGKDTQASCPDLVVWGCASRSCEGGSIRRCATVWGVCESTQRVHKSTQKCHELSSTATG